MVASPYFWEDGVVLLDHTRQKHTILREYFRQYVRVRCGMPQQERFRVAVVDGFAGGGRYESGEAGSPLIFIEELMTASAEINIERSQSGLKPLKISCLLILNDPEDDANRALQYHVSMLHEEAKANCPFLDLDVRIFKEKFEVLYPDVEKELRDQKYRNILFNLDQCGHSMVKRETITRIMQISISVEVFYTFMISSLLSFLRRSDPAGLEKQLRSFHIDPADIEQLLQPISKTHFLGLAEKLVYKSFQGVAPFHSPFSINNPRGWRYWLIHFSKMYRARQVYNRVLHENSGRQVHYGRAGLEMLSYDPSLDGKVNLFDDLGRQESREKLYDDIPRWISASGDSVTVEEFYQGVYNETIAHDDDIHTAIIDNPDLEALTVKGNPRRSASAINVRDILRLKSQPQFYFMHDRKK